MKSKKKNVLPIASNLIKYPVNQGVNNGTPKHISVISELSSTDLDHVNLTLGSGIDDLSRNKNDSLKSKGTIQLILQLVPRTLWLL